MDKGFLRYIKEKKDVTKIAIVLALGLILLFLGTKSEKTVYESDPDTEERIAAACSDIDGVGDCRVYLYYSQDEKKDSFNEVQSVIVVCEGADSIAVKLRLTEMLSSFFGIGANRVRIEKMRT